MRKSLVQTLAIFFLFVVGLTGCAIPKHAYTLMAPVGSTRDVEIADQKACLDVAQRLSHISLTAEESDRIGNVETGRFSEGGRGRSNFSDHYVLCFLNKRYQLLEHPVNWLSESNCERLAKYRSSGIEKERLKELCETRYKEEKCNACQSLQ